MATVMGVGIGIIILLVIWVVCLLLCVVCAQGQGGTSTYVAIVFPLLAMIITLTLWFFPKESVGEVAVQNIQVDDLTVIPREALVSLEAIVAFMSGWVYFFCHMVHPVMAQRYRATGY